MSKCNLVPWCLRGYESVAQNKADFQKGQMNANSCENRDCENACLRRRRRNKTSLSQFTTRAPNFLKSCRALPIFTVESKGSGMPLYVGHFESGGGSRSCRIRICPALVREPDVVQSINCLAQYALRTCNRICETHNQEDGRIEQKSEHHVRPTRWTGSKGTL